MISEDSPVSTPRTSRQSKRATRKRDLTASTRPFLKWVGGKRSILPALLKRMPLEYGKYCEPFVGGGALFFAVEPRTAYLSDVNPHLIATYASVKNDVAHLIKALAIHQEKHSPVYFARARERFSKEKEQTKIAALMIYLNKTCFNGLFRVSKTGKFNVPLGAYKSPCILDPEALQNASRSLRDAELAWHSFDRIPIEAGTFYYLDPPYHQTFSSYDGSGFGDSAHIALAEKCREIDASGGQFMLSNSDTEFIRRLYKGFHIEVVDARRSVSCKSYQRGQERELIVRNYKK